MLKYLEIMSKEVDRQPMCNDQGLLNILVWQRSLIREIDIRRVFVWNNFEGPLKTLDVGYFRDSSGLAYTNSGYPYCVLHQYKGDRSPEFEEMWEKIASTPTGESLPIAALPSAWDPISKRSYHDDFSRSLGTHGDSINIPRLPVPVVMYTPMPDNRFDHGVHSTVHLMDLNIPSSLPTLHISSTCDVWGFTDVQMKE
jgi:hypothetical protein